MTDPTLFRCPVPTEPTWPRRGKGGGLMNTLMGLSPEPTTTEDWLASTTPTGRNPNDPHEGISTAVLPDGRRMLLPDVLALVPEKMLGPDRTVPMLDVLVKFLDTLGRFGTQVHPTRDYAARYMHSPYGKAESWIILDTQVIDGEEPYILLGWSEPMTLERWTQIVLDGDVDAMLAAQNRIPVQPGDVYYVEGGWIHAAGTGILMVEVQEPSDHCLSTEHLCTKGQKPPEVIYNGLRFDDAMRMFTYDMPSGQEFIDLARQTPTLLRKTDSGEEWELFEPWATRWFDATRVSVTGTFSPEVRGMGHMFVVTGGHGVVKAEGGSLDLAPGSRVFMPFGAAEHEFTAATGESLSLVRCFPPEVQKNG